MERININEPIIKFIRGNISLISSSTSSHISIKPIDDLYAYCFNSRYHLREIDFEDNIK